MVKKLFRASALVFGIVCSSESVLSQDQKPPDTEISKPEFSITPRLNSTGFFPYTGAYLNKHINFDVNVYYENKGYGFFIFKSFDLEDSKAINNYLQPGIFKKFTIRPNLKIGPYFGYVFSQTAGFRDERDSDYYSALRVFWKINDKILVDNTALVSDIVNSATLANRLLVTVTIEDFLIDFYIWQRVVFETNNQSTSASVAINFPKLRISERAYVQSTVAYQSYLTENRPSFAMKNGLLVSIAVPISIARDRE